MKLHLPKALFKAVIAILSSLPLFTTASAEQATIPNNYKQTTVYTLDELISQTEQNLAFLIPPIETQGGLIFDFSQLDSPLTGHNYFFTGSDPQKASSLTFQYAKNRGFHEEGHPVYKSQGSVFCGLTDKSSSSFISLEKVHFHSNAKLAPFF